MALIPKLEYFTKCSRVEPLKKCCFTRTKEAKFILEILLRSQICTYGFRMVCRPPRAITWYSVLSSIPTDTQMREKLCSASFQLWTFTEMCSFWLGYVFDFKGNTAKILVSLKWDIHSPRAQSTPHLILSIYLPLRFKYAVKIALKFQLKHQRQLLAASTQRDIFYLLCSICD